MDVSCSRRAAPGLRKKTRIALIALAIAIPAAAIFPLACGGGVGIGILTIGLSLIFAGLSPGWAIRDPGFTRVPGSPEPAITLTSNDPAVDRCLVLGGELVPPLTIHGTATAGGGPSQLTFSLRLARGDEPGGVLAAAVITSTAVAVAQAPTAFTATLDFPRTPENTSYPGDIAILHIERTGSNDVTFDTTRSSVGAAVFLNRTVSLQIYRTVQGLPLISETPQSPQGSLTVPPGTTTTADYVFTAAGGPSYNITGVSSGKTTQPLAIVYEYDGPAAYSVVVSATASPTTFSLRLEDVSNRSAPKLLGDSGTLTADQTPRRIEASFGSAPPSWNFQTDSNAPTNQVLELSVANNGPGTLTLTFDPAGLNASRIILPGPRVRVTFPSVSDQPVSQPDPATPPQ
jgi:hypothetical protein